MSIYSFGDNRDLLIGPVANPGVATSYGVPEFDTDWRDHGPYHYNLYISPDNPGPGVARYDLGIGMFQYGKREGSQGQLDRARTWLEQHRDLPVDGSPNYFNPETFRKHVLGIEDGSQQIALFNPHRILVWQSFMNYVFEWPSGESAAVRKCHEIVKWRAYIDYDIWLDPTNYQSVDPNGDGPYWSKGAREVGNGLGWLTASILMGHGNESSMYAAGGKGPITALQMLDGAMTTLEGTQGQVNKPVAGNALAGSWPEGGGPLPPPNHFFTNYFMEGIICEGLVTVARAFPQYANRANAMLLKCYDGLENDAWLESQGGYRYSSPTAQDERNVFPDLQGHHLRHIAYLYLLTGEQKYKDRFLRLIDTIHFGNSWAGPGLMPPFSEKQAAQIWSRGAASGFGFLWLRDGGTLPPPPPPDPPPPPSGVSGRRAIVGFESGGHEALGTVGTVQTTQKHSGLYALRLQSQASPSRYGIINSTTVPHAINDSRGFMAVAVRIHVNSNPSSPVIWDAFALDDGVKGRGVALQIAVATNGALSARIYNYDAAAAITAITTTFSADTWVVFGIKADVAGLAAALEKDGVNIVDSTGLDIGTGNLTAASLFEPPNSSGLSLDYYADTVRVDVSVMPAHTSKIIARQFVSGTPAYNAFTKVGGTNIQDVCSETPGSATKHAKSTAASQAQTGAIADVGTGTDPIDDNDYVIAAQVVTLAKEIA